MPGNFKDEDARIQKTKEALTTAMTTLLSLRNFNRITVNDLCEEAMVGKTTFYYHYQNKYDLLKYWLAKTKSETISENVLHKDSKRKISNFLNNSDKTIRHLIEDANIETFGLLCDFMLSLLEMDKADNGQVFSKQAVLSKFCCGGIINYLQWQAENTSKINRKAMDAYFFDILDTLYKWNKEHE